MTDNLKHIPVGERKSIALRWAQRRAANSENPFTFMRRFEETLEIAAAFGEQHVLEERAIYKAPTQVAAEIEALAAVRSLRHWGTNWGRYVWETKHRVRKQRRAA